MAHKVMDEIWVNRNVQNAQFVLLEFGEKDEEYVLQDLRTLLATHGFSFTTQETTQIRNQLVIEGFLEEV